MSCSSEKRVMIIKNPKSVYVEGITGLGVGDVFAEGNYKRIEVSYYKDDNTSESIEDWNKSNESLESWFGSEEVTNSTDGLTRVDHPECEACQL